MKMKIEIRNDKAVVSGYVNAVGRDSRPITDVRGKFVEQIEPGAFRASLERSENVDLLLNHDKSKVYASTRDGSLKLTEDSIGLRAEAVLSDAEMIRKARSGEFRGWSFGMYVGDSAMEERAEGIPRRHVKSLNMFEVSLIDKSKIPCYVGTSVECRAEGEDVLAELRYSEEEPEIVEEERSEPEPVDYSAVDDVISELRYGALDNVIAELRYNPYHDPSTGRFASGGGGGGGGILVVEKGQKGKGFYVVPNEYFEKALPEHFEEEISGYRVTDGEITLKSGKTFSHYGKISELNSKEKDLAEKHEIDDPVGLETSGGKGLVPRSVGQKAAELYQNAKNNKAENLKRNVPGLNEVENVRNSRYAELDKHDQSIYSGSGRVYSPKVTKADVESVEAKYPTAVKYLHARNYMESSHYMKSSFGKKAMDDIRLGKNPDRVIAEMESEWSKYALSHAMD